MNGRGTKMQWTLLENICERVRCINFSVRNDDGKSTLFTCMFSNHKICVNPIYCFLWSGWTKWKTAKIIYDAIEFMAIGFCSVLRSTLPAQCVDHASPQYWQHEQTKQPHQYDSSVDDDDDDADDDEDDDVEGAGGDLGRLVTLNFLFGV